MNDLTCMQLKLHYGDLSDGTNLAYIIAECQPTEIYNLGAQSHVKVSFEMAEYTGDVDGLGTLRILDAIRTAGLERHVRFYQASTSELYGKVVETPQSETTPFYPRSPYGCAKMVSLLPGFLEAMLTRDLSTPTGSLSTTESRTACTPATVSSSTTSPHAEAEPSSPERSPARWPRSLAMSRTACTSATWTPSETGDTLETTSRACG